MLMKVKSNVVVVSKCVGDDDLGSLMLRGGETCVSVSVSGR